MEEEEEERRSAGLCLIEGECSIYKCSWVVASLYFGPSRVACMS